MCACACTASGHFSSARIRAVCTCFVVNCMENVHVHVPAVHGLSQVSPAGVPASRTGHIDTRLFILREESLCANPVRSGAEIRNAELWAAQSARAGRRRFPPDPPSAPGQVPTSNLSPLAKAQKLKPHESDASLGPRRTAVGGSEPTRQPADVILGEQRRPDRPIRRPCRPRGATGVPTGT